MSELDRAAMTLAGLTLAFLIAVAIVWWIRRPRPQVTLPKAPRMPREIRMPRLPRRAELEIEPVEIAPARLARLRAQPVYDPLPEDEPPTEVAPIAAETDTPSDALPPEPIEEMLAAQVQAVEAQAHGASEPLPIMDSPAAGHAVPASQARLVAQIPPRDAILTHNWVGGRPRLPGAMPWPRIEGTDADFIAQIACADLPAGLWDGLGPRTGALAFFVHPETGAATALHLPEVGPPRAAPKPVGRAYFRPAGLEDEALHRLAVRAFPEWAVDVRGADAPGTLAGADAAEAFFAATGYDLADPAFHPFDWPTMTGLAALLAARLPTLETGTAPPPDASDELTEALADAAATNRDAAERAREILAIIDESAGQAGFSASDASAVMTALHAIHWSRVVIESDAESGEDRTETITLPLTRHHPDAELWVSDYRALLFDHARHRWCADPDSLSAPARALFEPVWAALAAADAPLVGGPPRHYAPGFDEERDAMLVELPASALTGIAPAQGASLILAIRKADLAVGNFAALKALTGN